MITQKICLNTCEINHVIIYANKGEAKCRYIEVVFKDDETNDLSLSGYEVTFYAKKPDGTSIFNSCTVDTVNNTATAELTSQALSVSGVLECEFQIFNDSGTLLRVGGLKVAVAPERGFTDAIESSNEFNALISAIYEARGFADESTDFLTELGDLDDLTTTEKSTVVGAINELNGKTIPISQGGTGGQTAVEARTNLEVRKEYLLYSNSSGSSSSITLSDTYSNYDIIKVFFGANNIYNVFSFYTDLSHQVPISASYAYNTSNNLVGINFYGSFLYFSDTSVSFLRQCLGKISTSGNITLTNDTSLKVYKILGYKY